MVSWGPSSPEILGLRGSLLRRQGEARCHVVIVWPGHSRVGLTSWVSKLTQLRKCLSVIRIWSRDRWWSLEEGKFTPSPGLGEGRPNSAPGC